MRRILITVAAVLFSMAALAQQYKWVDEKGRTQYGDTPPPGAKATRLKPPPSGQAAEPASKAPLTPAEREALFRKRQQEADKGRQKDELAAKDADTKRANCERAQEYVRSLESGFRVSRLNAQGERYFLDDDQRAAEVAQARQNAAQSCAK